jgi:hypothetical protein
MFKAQPKIDKGSQKTSTIAPATKPTPSPQKDDDEDRDVGLFIGTRGVH